LKFEIINITLLGRILPFKSFCFLHLFSISSVLLLLYFVVGQVFMLSKRSPNGFRWSWPLLSLRLPRSSSSFLGCLCVFMLNGSPSSIIYNFFVPSGIRFIFLFLPISWVYRSTRLSFAYCCYFARFCVILLWIWFSFRHQHVYSSGFLLLQFFCCFICKATPTNKCTLRFGGDDSFQKHGIGFELDV